MVNQALSQSASSPLVVASGQSTASSSPSTQSASTPSQPQRQKRPAGESPGEGPKAPRKNRLQEQHKRMIAVESNLVKRFGHARGARGFGYKCLKCGVVKLTRLRAIGHAANCGRKKTGKKRGKSKKILKCNLCQKTANTVKDLCKHRREEHAMVLGRAGFKCTRCLKTFTYSQNYKLHMIMHKQDGSRFSCDICPLKFKYLRNVKRHKLSHLQDRPRHQCTTCGKTFKQSSHLARHVMSHQGPEVRFKCTICKVEFSRIDSLRRHKVKSHLGVGSSLLVTGINQVELESGTLDDDSENDKLSSDIIEVLRACGYSEEEINHLVEKYRKLPLESPSSASSPATNASFSIPLSTSTSTSSNTSLSNSISTSSTSPSSASLTGPTCSSSLLARSSPSADGDPSSISSGLSQSPASKWSRFLPPPSPTASRTLKHTFVCEICGGDPFRDNFNLDRHMRDMHGTSCHKL